jgi:hypothetical protein
MTIITCPKCCEVNPNLKMYCTGCGYNLRRPPQITEDKPRRLTKTRPKQQASTGHVSQKSKRPLIVIGICVLLSCVLCNVGGLIWSKLEDSSKSQREAKNHLQLCTELTQEGEYIKALENCQEASQWNSEDYDENVQESIEDQAQETLRLLSEDIALFSQDYFDAVRTRVCDQSLGLAGQECQDGWKCLGTDSFSLDDLGIFKAQGEPKMAIACDPNRFPLAREIMASKPSNLYYVVNVEMVLPPIHVERCTYNLYKTYVGGGAETWVVGYVDREQLRFKVEVISVESAMIDYEKVFLGSIPPDCPEKDSVQFYDNDDGIETLSGDGLSDPLFEEINDWLKSVIE